MPTKSIQLTQEEATELERFVAATGQVEAEVLRRAALRGLEELRLERGVRAYLEGKDSYEAAEIAGVGRAEILWELMERGVTILKGPSYMAETLQSLAEELGNEKLAAVARKLGETQDTREAQEARV